MNKQAGALSRYNEADLNLPDVIKICHFEMDDDAIQRLNTMFAIIFKGRFRLVSSDEAMLSIIYINSPMKEAALLASYQKQYSGLPIIVLVDSLADKSQDKVQDNVYYIERPLRREPFWNAVVTLLAEDKVGKSVSKEQLNKAEQTQTASSAQALNNKIDKKPAKTEVSWLNVKPSEELIYYKPKKYLLFYLKKLIGDTYPAQSVLKIELLHKYHLILYPDKKLALFNFSQSRIRTLALMKIKDFTDDKKCQLSILNDVKVDKHFAENQAGFSTMTFDALLWAFAVQTSKGGRLPKGTSINQKMHLYAWPNLTRLEKIPHAMRIASLWINAPYSLHEIAVILDINQEDVFSFYTAASVLGLVATDEQENADHDTAPVVEGKTPAENQKRGLFGAIIRRLTGH